MKPRIALPTSHKLINKERAEVSSYVAKNACNLSICALPTGVKSITGSPGHAPFPDVTSLRQLGSTCKAEERVAGARQVEKGAVVDRCVGVCVGLEPLVVVGNLQPVAKIQAV